MHLLQWLFFDGIDMHSVLVFSIRIVEFDCISFPLPNLHWLDQFKLDAPFDWLRVDGSSFVDQWSKESVSVGFRFVVGGRSFQKAHRQNEIHWNRRGNKISARNRPTEKRKAKIDRIDSTQNRPPLFGCWNGFTRWQKPPELNVLFFCVLFHTDRPSAARLCQISFSEQFWTNRVSEIRSSYAWRSQTDLSTHTMRIRISTNAQQQMRIRISISGHMRLKHNPFDSWGHQSQKD